MVLDRVKPSAPGMWMSSRATSNASALQQRQRLVGVAGLATYQRWTALRSRPAACAGVRGASGSSVDDQYFQAHWVNRSAAHCGAQRLRAVVQSQPAHLQPAGMRCELFRAAVLSSCRNLDPHAGRHPLCRTALELALHVVHQVEPRRAHCSAPRHGRAAPCPDGHGIGDFDHHGGACAFALDTRTVGAAGAGLYPVDLTAFSTSGCSSSGGRHGAALPAGRIRPLAACSRSPKRTCSMAR